MKIKEKCIKKRGWFRLDLANIQKKWKLACNHWEWRRNALKNGIGSDWIWPIYKKSATRIEANQNEVEMHLKKGIGSDWIWPIYRRSAGRLATNENEGEMCSESGIGSVWIRRSDDRLATNENEGEMHLKTKNRIRFWLHLANIRVLENCIQDCSQWESCRNAFNQRGLIRTASGQSDCMDKLHPGLQPIRIKEKLFHQ